jgi:hypothetical protein
MPGYQNKRKMNQYANLALSLLCSLSTLWILPQVLKEDPEAFIKSHDYSGCESIDGIIDDPDFLELMDEVGKIGRSCLNLVKEGNVYEIKFKEDPIPQDLEQADLQRLLSDLGYASAEQFQSGFYNQLFELNQLQHKYPQLLNFDVHGWLNLIKEVNNLHPNILWSARDEGCDDWCMAEAYAEYLASISSLAIGVVSTSAVPPLAGIVAFSGSALAIFRFLNNLRKCCNH